MSVIANLNALKQLRDVLSVGKARTIQRDSCRDPMLIGRHGHVYVDGLGFLIVLYPGSARRWSHAKRSLAGMARLTQNGDDEGCLHLPRWPDPLQAKDLRSVLGLPKRRPPPAKPFAKIIDPEAS